MIDFISRIEIDSFEIILNTDDYEVHKRIENAITNEIDQSNKQRQIKNSKCKYCGYAPKPIYPPYADEYNWIVCPICGKHKYHDTTKKTTKKDYKEN